MIERFILPERLARSAQQFIRASRGNSLYKLRDFRCGRSWVDQQVDMIWHHDKRDKAVKRANLFATLYRLSYTLGYSRLLKP